MSAKVSVSKDPHRVRSEDLSSTVVTRVLDTQTNYGNVTYPRDVTILGKQVNKRSMTDIVTPRYTQRVANGEIIMNPMSSTSTVQTGGDSGLQVFNPGDGNSSYRVDISRVTGTAIPYPVPAAFSTNVANLKVLASTDCLSKVSNSGFQGLVAIAELHKTFDMLLNPLQTIQSLTSWVAQQRAGKKNLSISNTYNIVINGRTFPKGQRTLIRKSKQQPGKVIKTPKSNIVVPIGSAVSGTVLAINMGLRPLMSDLDAVLNEIPQSHQRKYVFTHSQQSVSESATSSGESDVWSTASVKWTNVTKTKISVKATAVSLDRVDVLRDFGMSLSDIPSAAWELIPYSWLIDYFTNVGNLLSSIRVAYSGEIVASCLSTVIDQTVVRTYGTNTAVSSYYMTRSVGGTVSTRVITKTRELGLESAGFAYKPAPFRAAVIQNLLSLIVQNLTTINSGHRSAFR